MKKIIKAAMLVCLITTFMFLITSCDFSVFFEKKTDSGLVYEINDDGKTCTITKLRSSTATDITIPSEIEGYRVTSIGRGAFFDCKQLNSVALPDTITHIGDDAFYGCINLNGITIPPSVTQIENAALCYVKSIYIENVEAWLKICQQSQPIAKGSSIIHVLDKDGKEVSELVIPNGVTEVGVSAFYGCYSLINVVFPEGVTKIGSGAFADCENLVSVSLPEELKEIGQDAFKNCVLLENIVVPESVTVVNSDAFSNCKHITVQRGQQRTGNDSFFWEGLSAKSISIVVSEGITEITLGYFWPLHVGQIITNITLPSSLREVGLEAFGECSALTSIIIPDGVTSIGTNAFHGCRRLENITIPDTVAEIGDSAFSGCTSLKSIKLPDNLRNIGPRAFSECTSLEEIVIPSGVTSIEHQTFHNCSSLTNVDLPESLTVLGTFAFDGCTSLTNVWLPDKLMRLDLSAFTGCVALKNITIPKSVVNLSGTFSGLIALERIEVSKDNPIYSSDGNCIIKKYDNFVTLLAGCNNSVIPQGVTHIASGAFEGFDKLVNVVIPDGVQRIQKGAFSNCANLASIRIPNTVIEIASGAFQYCDSLTNIILSEDHPIYYSSGNCIIDRKNNSLIWGCKNSVIPEGVVSIGYGAFKGCIGLTSIEIPNGVIYIRDSAFYGCTSLTSINLPDTLEIIENNAFRGCSSLTSINIPEGVTSIGNLAFLGCPLFNIEIPDSVKIIGADAFPISALRLKNGVYYADKWAVSCDTYGISSVALQDNTIAIGDSAFVFARSTLTSIRIPNGVKNIGSYAFNHCGNLTSITFNGTVEQWSAIEKSSSWDSNTATYTIYCTDGEIAKDGTVTYY